MLEKNGSISSWKDAFSNLQTHVAAAYLESGTVSSRVHIRGHKVCHKRSLTGSENDEVSNVVPFVRRRTGIPDGIADTVKHAGAAGNGYMPSRWW